MAGAAQKLLTIVAGRGVMGADRVIGAELATFEGAPDMAADVVSGHDEAAERPFGVSTQTPAERMPGWRSRRKTTANFEVRRGHSRLLGVQPCPVVGGQRGEFRLGFGVVVVWPDEIELKCSDELGADFHRVHKTGVPECRTVGEPNPCPPATGVWQVREILDRGRGVRKLPALERLNATIAQLLQ